MKSKWILFVFTVCLSPLVSVAAGTILLDGKIKSFSPKLVELNDGHRVYVVERKKLTSADDAKLKAATTGENVQLQIPFEAVVSAKKIN